MNREDSFPLTPTEATALAAVVVGLGVWIHLVADDQVAALVLDGMLLALFTAGYFMGTVIALRDWKHQTVLRSRRDGTAPRPDLPLRTTMAIRFAVGVLAFAAAGVGVVATRVISDEPRLTGPMVTGLLLGVAFSYIGTFHLMGVPNRRS